MQQRTPEWFAARVGKATASRVSHIITRTKSGYSASRAKYAGELIAERLTGQPYPERYTNAAMQWGLDTEPEARAAYAFARDCDIDEVGFINHPTIAMSGASPDGLVGSDGLVEIKCPDTHTHLEILRAVAKSQRETIPLEYVSQMQWQLACTNRAWCDFVSYDPRMPDRMQLYVQRVQRSDNVLKQLTSEVEQFLEEVAAEVELYRDYYLVGRKVA